MRQDYSPQAMQERQLDRQWFKVICFVAFVLNMLMALAIFALAMSGPIKFITGVIGVCNLIGMVASIWVIGRNQL